MSYRPANEATLHALYNCRDHLHHALTFARKANCPGLTAKIRSALKSHEGATRHCLHRITHTAQ